MKLLKQLFGTLLSQIIAAGVLFGALYLLFTNLRFDHAAIGFGAIILALIVLIYWPRKQK